MKNNMLYNGPTRLAIKGTKRDKDSSGQQFKKKYKKFPDHGEKSRKICVDFKMFLCFSTLFFQCTIMTKISLAKLCLKLENINSKLEAGITG